MKTAEEMKLKITTESMWGTCLKEESSNRFVAFKMKASDANIICKSVNAYPELIQTLKDLKEVLIEAKLTIHAKGIDVLLKKYE